MTGEPDFSGDGGSATSAAINISAIAVDGLGDGFIAEPGMPGICEITTGGIINTIAGIGMCSYDDFMAGKCLSVFGRWRPGYGWQIFPALPWTGVDRAGNVYVADASDNVIRVARPVQ